MKKKTFINYLTIFLNTLLIFGAFFLGDSSFSKGNVKNSILHNQYLIEGAKVTIKEGKRVGGSAIEFSVTINTSEDKIINKVSVQDTCPDHQSYISAKIKEPQAKTNKMFTVLLDAIVQDKEYSKCKMIFSYGKGEKVEEWMPKFYISEEEVIMGEIKQTSLNTATIDIEVKTPWRKEPYKIDEHKGVWIQGSRGEYTGRIIGKAETNTKFTFEIHNLIIGNYPITYLTISYGEKNSIYGGDIIKLMYNFSVYDFTVKANNFKQISKDSGTYNIKTFAPWIKNGEKIKSLLIYTPEQKLMHVEYPSETAIINKNFTITIKNLITNKIYSGCQLLICCMDNNKYIQTECILPDFSLKDGYISVEPFIQTGVQKGKIKICVFGMYENKHKSIQKVEISKGDKILKTSWDDDAKTEQPFYVTIDNLESEKTYLNYKITVFYDFQQGEGYTKQASQILNEFNIEGFDIITTDIDVSHGGQATFELELATKSLSNHLSITDLIIHRGEGDKEAKIIKKDDIHIFDKFERITISNLKEGNHSGWSIEVHYKTLEKDSNAALIKNLQIKDFKTIASKPLPIPKPKNDNKINIWEILTFVFIGISLVSILVINKLYVRKK